MSRQASRRVGWWFAIAPVGAALLLICLAVPRLAANSVVDRTQKSASVTATPPPELIVQRSHVEKVQRVSFSSDGRFLLSTSLQDSVTKLWHAEGLREIRTFRLPECSLPVFAPGNRALACADDGVVRFIELATGREQRRLRAVSARQIVAFVNGPESMVVRTTGDAVQLISSLDGSLLFEFIKSSGRDADRRIEVSRDGRVLAIERSEDRFELWDAVARRSIGVLPFLADEVMPGDSTAYVVVRRANQVRLWDTSARTDRGSLLLTGELRGSSLAAVSADGRRVALRRGQHARVFELPSFRLLNEIDSGAGEAAFRAVWDDLRPGITPGAFAVETASFSPDGASLAVGLAPRRRPSPTPLKVYQLRGNAPAVETTTSRAAIPRSLAFHPTKPVLAVAAGRETVFWNLDTGVEAFRAAAGDEVNRVVFTPGADFITGSDAYRETQERVVRHSESGVRRQIFVKPDESTGPVRPEVPHITALAVSADGKRLAVGQRTFRGNSGQVYLWNLSEPKNQDDDRATSGSKLAASHDCPVTYTGFTADGALLVTGSECETAGAQVNVWNPATRQLLGPLVGARLPLAVHSTDAFLAARSADGGVQIWDLRTRSAGRSFGAPEPPAALAYTRDGTLAGGSESGLLMVWNQHHQLIARQTIHNGAVRDFAFRDGVMASTADDLTIGLWRLSPAGELSAIGRVVIFEEGDWAAFAPDGRFDASHPEALTGLHWLLHGPDLRTLRPEVFMRDYYEPRVLSRRLEGEVFSALPSVAERNPIQPLVEIEPVRWIDEEQGIAEVIVKVARVVEPAQEGAGQQRIGEPYDLRLFRGGQLVKSEPRTSLDWQRGRGGQTSEEDDARWRRQTKLDLQPSGTARIPFTVYVARRTNGVSDVPASDVVFTAYAFNQDRVKSITARRVVSLPERLPLRRGAAFVIAVGVNRTKSGSSWDLEYAAKDARAIAESLQARLQATGRFDYVSAVPLISDRAPLRANEREATKTQLRETLEFLSGARAPTIVDAIESSKGVSGLSGLTRARPEDVVVLAVSSHGYTDADGIFHFVLADSVAGPDGGVSRELDASSLSTDELSAWLRPIDAGQVVLIVDACYSDATVTADGFKPGPMGSRGLGQLAYDKGARVLAASKAAAFERGGGIDHGLLTYALVREGLDQGKADHSPSDERVTMSEWLRYAVDAVPRIFTQAGSQVPADNATPLLTEEERKREAFHGRVRLRYQQPVLFNFAPAARDLVLIAAPHRANRR